MTIGRAAGLTLVVAGIIAGTLLGRTAAREIPRANGYFVLAGDFHVHAALGDGAVPPWELVREAERRGLDVIVVSNHNQRLAARLAARLPRAGSSRPIVIVGQEVTTPAFHMIAAGISETIDWRLSGSDAIRAIHAQGGVAIAAHPTVHSWRADDGAMALLDGAEAVHPLAFASVREGQQLVDFYRTAAGRNPSLAPIGSSDFHFAGTLGECRTYLFVREISQAGVLDAIRDARTVAYGRDGRLFGDPVLVSAVEPLVKANRPPSSSDLPSRIAAWLCLVGVLMLLLWK
jgi:hypothetical protein